MSKSKRDQFRTATLGAEAKFKSQDLEVAGMSVRVRAPTVEERAAIVTSAGQVDEKGNVKPDLAKLQVNSVIALTVSPETGEKMFEENDRAAMLAAPAGGWFDKLAEVATRLINVDLDDSKNA